MSRRLLVLAPSAYRVGGVQTWLDYLLPGLAERGWGPVLGLVAGDHHDAAAYLRAHPFAEVEIVDDRTGTRRGRIRSLAASIAKRRPEMVVVVNLADAYLAAARVRQAGRPDLKIVATLHGLQPDFLQDFARYRDQLDAVICTNRLAGAMAVAWSGLDPARVLYAPYGVEAGAAGEEGKERRGDGDRDGPLRLAYAGRLEAVQKRVYDVVEILRQGVGSGLDLTLTVAGEGPDDDGFRAAVAAAGLSERVRHLGALDAADMGPRLYDRCDAMLVTSSWETGPIVAWEAMARGLVLATSDYLGRKREGRLIDGMNCVVFPVGDIAAAVAALKRLRDPSTKERIAAAGRTLALDAYSRTRSIAAWADGLERVAALPALPKGEVEPLCDAPGRLDRVLGGEGAELARRLLGRRHAHRDPGGEWPHSYGDRPADDPEFWAMARRLDTPRPLGSPASS